MTENEKETELPAREWWTRYGVGVGLGPLMALYGCFALLMGRTFLPGLQGENWTIGGKSGQALAGAYLVGGLYLLLRLYLEKTLDSQSQKSLLYAVQCLLLVGLIALLIYVLLHVGEVV